MRELLFELRSLLVQGLNEENYTPGEGGGGGKHKKLFFNARKILRNSLSIFSIVFLFFVFLFSPQSLVYNLPLFFPRFSEISLMRVTFDRGVVWRWCHAKLVWRMKKNSY